jgi:hypothetical protein
MTGRLLPPVRTPATTAAVLAALAVAAPELGRRSILILLAQSALETGWWRSAWCWNFGNAKHVEGRTEGSWTFFSCDELLSSAQAKDFLARAKPRTDGPAGLDVELDPKPRPDGLVRTLFHPSHRGCRFRAFESLEEGIADHVAMLRRRYPEAWAHAIAGDAAAYSRALKAGRYYTAPEQGYTASLVSIVAQLDRQVPRLEIAVAETPPPGPPATHRDDALALALDRQAREALDTIDDV